MTLASVVSAVIASSETYPTAGPLRITLLHGHNYQYAVLYRFLSVGAWGRARRRLGG